MSNSNNPTSSDQPQANALANGRDNGEPNTTMGLEEQIKREGIVSRSPLVPGSRSTQIVEIELDTLMGLVNAHIEAEVAKAEEITYDIAFKDGINHATVNNQPNKESEA